MLVVLSYFSPLLLICKLDLSVKCSLTSLVWSAWVWMQKKLNSIVFILNPLAHHTIGKMSRYRYVWQLECCTLGEHVCRPDLKTLTGFVIPLQILLLTDSYFWGKWTESMSRHCTLVWNSICSLNLIWKLMRLPGIFTQILWTEDF